MIQEWDKVGKRNSVERTQLVFYSLRFQPLQLKLHEESLSRIIRDKIADTSLMLAVSAYGE